LIAQADPAKLAEVALRHDHWSTSAHILRSIMQPNARVAVKACHASSKTFTAADAVLLALIEGGDVLTTAPTWDQVQNVLWEQIRRAVADSRIPLLDWGSVNLTDITLPTGERAIGLSTNEGVRFQGWHARPESFLLVVFDEAPGVRADIWEAVQGIAAGGDVRILAIGNPVIASGPFYDVYSGQAPGWTRLTIDAFDTPNLAGLTLERLLALPEHELDDNPRPYLVTRRWVRDAYYSGAWIIRCGNPACAASSRCNRTTRCCRWPGSRRPTVRRSTSRPR
jgi:phage terminase large subunit